MQEKQGARCKYGLPVGRSASLPVGENTDVVMSDEEMKYKIEIVFSR